MTLLQLLPLTKPVAISEMLILLAIAALLGWGIAKLIVRGKISNLKELIEERKIELAECRSIITNVRTETAPLVGHASKTVYPVRDSGPVKPDDLTVIEGVGPKIQELLNKEGIYTYAVLAETSPIRISNILRNAGPRFQVHDPTTWPKQAELANQGKWSELETLKNKLISGRSTD